MLGIGHFNGSLDKAESVYPVRGSGLGAGRDHSAQLGNQQPVECVSYHGLWPGRLQVTPPPLVQADPACRCPTFTASNIYCPDILWPVMLSCDS